MVLRFDNNKKLSLLLVLKCDIISMFFERKTSYFIDHTELLQIVMWGFV